MRPWAPIWTRGVGEGGIGTGAGSADRSLAGLAAGGFDFVQNSRQGDAAESWTGGMSPWSAASPPGGGARGLPTYTEGEIKFYLTAKPAEGLTPTAAGRRWGTPTRTSLAPGEAPALHSDSKNVISRFCGNRNGAVSCRPGPRRSIPTRTPIDWPASAA